MRVTIAAIGKLKSGSELELVTLYAERCAQQGKLCGMSGIEIKEITESRLSSLAERRNEEATKLLKAVPPGAMAIMLDERAKQLQSKELANHIAHWRDEGASELVFLLGGADGHGSAVKQASQFALSLGAMTWPHKLARVMIAEQIYRAMTILTNHPYHRA